MTRMANDYERADHYRDERKHEPRATDPLPLRFERPMSLAEQVAINVKKLSNITAAAGLIEDYAQLVAQAALLDKRVSK